MGQSLQDYMKQTLKAEGYTGESVQDLLRQFYVVNLGLADENNLTLDDLAKMFYVDALGEGANLDLATLEYRYYTEVAGLTGNSISDMRRQFTYVLVTNAFVTGDHYISLDTQDGTDTGENQTYPMILTPNSVGLVAETSLRLDGDGAATSFPGSKYLQTASTGDNRWNFDYSNGLTVEYLVKHNSFYTRAGQGTVGVGVAAQSNSGATAVWRLGIDNWDTGTGDPEFSFALLQDNTSYYDTNDYVIGKLIDVRSPDATVVGTTYHVLGTVNVTTGQVDLYVNGVLKASDTLSAPDLATWLSVGHIWYDLTNPSRERRSYIDIGTLMFDGAWRTVDGILDEVKVHSKYMTSLEAWNQASILTGLPGGLVPDGVDLTLNSYTTNPPSPTTWLLEPNAVEVISSNNSPWAHDPNWNVLWNAGGKYFAQFRIDLSGNAASSGITGNWSCGGTAANTIVSPNSISKDYMRVDLFNSSGLNTVLDVNVRSSFPGVVTTTTLQSSLFPYDKNDVNASNVYNIGIAYDLDLNKMFVCVDGVWAWDNATGSTTGGDPSMSDPGFPISGGSTNEAVALAYVYNAPSQTNKVATVEMVTPYRTPAGYTPVT